MGRHNNQLPDNLPQLQNLIKRDPDSYKEEFLQQLMHYKSTMDIFKLTPHQNSKTLEDQTMFLAQVAQCYPIELKTFPQQLIDILNTHSTVLERGVRMTFCKALILLRNKNLITPYNLLETFFELLKCQDKALRDFLRSHIITDIKSINAKQKDVKINSGLQNFMYSMLKDSNVWSAKMSIDIMIELYQKNVWNDAKTVNVIANTGCFSKITKVMVASLKFFLGKDDEDQNSDDESEEELNAKEVIMSNKFNKKTRKREKQLEKVKKIVHAKKKKSKAPAFNFSALQLLNDPQGFAEKLFKQLDSSNERFEVKLMTLDVISRLIGLHELFLFNFYPFLTKLIQPHQREVTKILQFAAQSSHELVPPDVIEPIVKALVNNFVTERNTSDVMAIGLNAVREICARCPLSMGEDLLKDLAQYKNYKDRSVMMAAKSLIVLYRTSMPELLHKKDRGRPSEATAEVKSKKYGEKDIITHIPGSEVLLEEDKDEESSGEESDSSGWVDVDSDGNVSDSGDSSDDEVTAPQDQSHIDDSNKRKILKAQRKCVAEDKMETAQQIASERIFTDEDFKRIDRENVKKHLRAAKGTKRKYAEMEASNSSEFVKLSDIENIYKKKKHDKKSRMESVRAGRKDRDKFGYKDGRQNVHCSKTNKEKKKSKNYQMVIHKAKGKVKRSFKEKQVALKNYLIKQKKMR